MKIAVYAIAKNEAKHAERWFKSMSEADGVFVLDTGSTDGTPELFRKLGAKVVAECRFEPFHFADARNASLSLVPTDYDWCVCTDIDEVFQEGWRKRLEDALADCKDQRVNSALCEFVTSFNDDGTPKDTMDYWKIHRRDCVYWEGRCHEYLCWRGQRFKLWVDGMRLEHHPDGTKSRAQYLPMLELSAAEDPSPRNLFYLGRELMFVGRRAGAIAVLCEYVSHPDAKWKAERAWAMRFIARCLRMEGELPAAVRWYVRAAREDETQRESLVEYARFCYNAGDPVEAVKALEVALQRKVRPKEFFTEEDCWDGTPERLLAEWTSNNQTGKKEE